LFYILLIDEKLPNLSLKHLRNSLSLLVLISPGIPQSLVDIFMIHQLLDKEYIVVLYSICSEGIPQSVVANFVLFIT